MIETIPNLPIDLPMEAIGELCRKYHVQELSLFGSVLRDDFRPESDVDFLVLFQPGATIGFIEFIGMQHALQDLLGRPVDLVPKKGLKALIRQSVLDSSRG